MRPRGPLSFLRGSRRSWRACLGGLARTLCKGPETRPARKFGGGWGAGEPPRPRGDVWVLGGGSRGGFGMRVWGAAQCNFNLEKSLQTRRGERATQGRREGKRRCAAKAQAGVGACCGLGVQTAGEAARLGTDSKGGRRNPAPCWRGGGTEGPSPPLPLPSPRPPV